MTSYASVVNSMAACPQLPFDLSREPQAAGLDCRRPSRASDILTISGNASLSIYLSALFHKSGWAMARARTCEEGLSFLTTERAAVAVCEESLPDGFWHDLAAAFRSLPEPPALIVVSDEYSIVQEVLASGGFDVLVRPLQEADVVWTIASAWHAWMKRFGRSGTGAP
jgi:DNA-binding NtrC family response regulator